ncbi:MAG: tetratricopeptide repeat-containing protein [Acidobacteriota bacterium]
MRKLALCLLFCLIFPSSLLYADEYYNLQLNKGIRNSDTYAYLLIEKARADSAGSVELLHEALTDAPDLPAVYFALSKATFSLSGSGILDSVDYVIRGIDAYSRNFWWSFTLMGSLFFDLIFSFIMAVLLIVAVRLLPDVPLLSHDIGESSWKVALLIMMVVFSAASPLLFLGSMVVLLGFYMKKYSRSVVYLYLLFLFCFPLLSKTASLYLGAASSGSLKAIVAVNESEGNGYAVSTLQNRDDFASLFSYALALKREGRYEEAIASYKRLLEKKEDPRIYVNLGNCYVGLYNFDEARKSDLEEAVKYYSSSLRIKPLVSAHYNLSQVSREMLDFGKGEEYFRSALAMDRSAVAGYRAISGRKPNRFVVDEPLKPSEFWDYALSRNDSPSSLGVAAVPPFAVSLAALLLGVVFYIMNSRVRQRAYRCRKCYKILCEKCEKRIVWGRMCPECYSSLIKLEEMDVRDRVARLLSIYEQQTRHRNFLKVLSFVLPGLAEVYGGRVFLGLLFLWSFLFLFLLPVMVFLFVPDSHLVSHSFIKWAALVLAGLLYGVFLLITRKRIAKGWL